MLHETCNHSTCQLLHEGMFLSRDAKLHSFMLLGLPPSNTELVWHLAVAVCNTSARYALCGGIAHTGFSFVPVAASKRLNVAMKRISSVGVLLCFSATHLLTVTDHSTSLVLNVVRVTTKRSADSGLVTIGPGDTGLICLQALTHEGAL
jgi:hypothetical protein